MLYQLNIEQRKVLQMLPETKMGSQHVDIYFKDGSILKNISVYNCSEFESDKKLDLNLVERIELAEGS